MNASSSRPLHPISELPRADSVFVGKRVIAALLVMGITGIGPGYAATVRPLVLPAGFTVRPESDHRLMWIGPDGTVYAIASRANSPGTVALRWQRGSYGPDVFSPIAMRGEEDSTSAARAEAVVPAGESVYVTLGRSFDGAYIGTQFSIEQWFVGAHTETWSAPACAGTGSDSVHVYAADQGRVALSIDPSSNSSGVDLGDPTSIERNLPRAVVLEGNHCESLGTATLTGLRGAIVVGYIGYLNGKPAPRSINVLGKHQRIDVLRWRDGHEADLGAGVPFATTSSGVVVGASAMPGDAPDVYPSTKPHAVLWSRDGSRSDLVHGDARSTAWDIDEQGTVVGVTESANGRHYAFRNDGRWVALLDDLPHPPGWRFESAYAIVLDGAVAGIGRYHGIPTAFVWRP